MAKLLFAVLEVRTVRHLSMKSAVLVTHANL